MALSQIQFLGASVRNFNTSIGWDTQSSTIEVSVVEDASNGDVFAPPVIGAPVSFQYEAFRFDGILNNYFEKNSISGKPVYSVILSDPRQVLEGCQVILDSYTGSIFGMPNLYNVYGALESTGFGNAQVNEVGIPWKKVQDTLTTLVAGTPINFRGFQYFLDISRLPNLTDVYRVPGANISILEFISNICETANSDYFITLLGNVIFVDTISRKDQPTFGRIQQFINATDNVSSNSKGFELEYNTTSKFLVGGDQERIFFNFSEDFFEPDENTDPPETDNDDPTPEDNTIWPYWGVDRNGNAIVGKGLDNKHKFTLNGDAIPYFGDWRSGYTSDVEEMRAALSGQDAWEAFLIANDEVEGQHLGKATRLKLKGNITGALPEVLNGKVEEGEVDGLVVADAAPMKFIDNNDLFDRLDAQQAVMFRFVETFANEYYGVKFMVRIPFVFVKREPETNLIVTSLEPAKSGYIDEGNLGNFIGNNLLPIDVKKVLDEDTKIVCYVRFDNLDVIDVSALSEDSYTVSQGSVFVKADLDPKIIYLNNQTLFSPRVIVTLPGPLQNSEEVTDYTAQLQKMINKAKNPEVEGGGEADKDDDAKKILAQFGANVFFFGESSPRIAPGMAAVPLKSNILTYGPWFSIGANGRTDFEVNTQLVPWNFGGFDGLNQAGEAEVSVALSNRQVQESGEVTVAGAPTLSLGEQLVFGGPYVSSIQITVATEGVTSTYKFQTWNVRPGKSIRYQLDRQKRLTRTVQQQRRAFRELFRPVPPLIPSKTNVRLEGTNLPSRRNSRDAHPTQMIGEDSRVQGSGTDGTTKHNVAGVSNKDAGGIFNVDASGDIYRKKAGCSVDGLYRGYATSPDDTNFPHFINPSGDEFPTVNDLNPFSSTHDVQSVISGDTPPDSLNDKASDNRPMGIRFPAVGVGWGADINGKPVPADPSDPDVFFPDHENRSDMHKAGPIDLRWDEERGVWGGPGATIKRLTLDTAYLGDDGILFIGSGDALDTDGNTVVARDLTKRSFLLSGETFMAIKGGTGIYDIMGEVGLKRAVTTDDEFLPGASGLCTTKISGGFKLNVFLDWMHNGIGVSGDAEAIAEYFPEEIIWRMTGAACT